MGDLYALPPDVLGGATLEGEAVTIGDERWVRFPAGGGTRVYMEESAVAKVGPEPPVGAVVLDTRGCAWQRRQDDEEPRWYSTDADPLDEDWADLNKTWGPLVRLVPDPSAEPVTLPWEHGGGALWAAADDDKTGAS